MRFEIKGTPWELVTIALAGASLVLVIVNAALVVRNQSIQVEVTQRQEVINQGMQFARIRQALAQFLGNLAVSKQDHALSELLARHGITITSPAPAAPQGK